MRLHVSQHSRLNAAVRKINAAVFFGMAILRIAVAVLDLRERELYGLRIPVFG